MELEGEEAAALALEADEVGEAYQPVGVAGEAERVTIGQLAGLRDATEDLSLQEGLALAVLGLGERAGDRQLLLRRLGRCHRRIVLSLQEHIIRWVGLSPRPGSTILLQV